MLSSDDIKQLTDKRFAFKNVTWPMIGYVIAFFVVIGGLVNLYNAHLWAVKIDLGILDIIPIWIDSSSYSKLNSGIVFASIEQISTAFLQFCMAIIMIVYSVKVKKRDDLFDRIIKELDLENYDIL